MGHQQRQHGLAQPPGQQQCQQPGLQKQRQHQRHSGIAAQTRILHDAQRRLAVGAAAQTIADIGQAILVNGARDPGRSDHRQHHGHQRHQGKLPTQQPPAQRQNRRRHARHQPAHPRKVGRGRLHHGRAVAHPRRQPSRQRHAGEVLHRQQQVTDKASQTGRPVRRRRGLWHLRLHAPSPSPAERSRSAPGRPIQAAATPA